MHYNNIYIGIPGNTTALFIHKVVYVEMKDFNQKISAGD